MEENEFKNLIIKVLIPAFVAVSVKIAIDSRKRAVSLLNVVASFVIGIGSAYIFSSAILSNFSSDYVPLMIALVAISGDKIGSWLIYKLNIDSLIKAVIDKYYER